MLRACSSVLLSGVPPRGLLAILGFNCRPLPLFFTWWVSPRRPRWVHGTAVVSGWGQGTHHAVRGSLVHVRRATGHTRSLGSWSWRTSITRRMTWKNRAALILDRNTHLVVHGATQLGRYGSPHLIGYGSSQLTWHGSPDLRFRHGGAAVLKVRRGQRVLTRRATELHLQKKKWTAPGREFAICNLQFSPLGQEGGWLNPAGRSSWNFPGFPLPPATGCSHWCLSASQRLQSKQVSLATTFLTWITSLTRYLHMSPKLSKVSFAICQP